MKGYSVYNAIKQLKDQGFKKAAVARQLDINRRTVDRYWDMSVDEYEAMKSEVRRKQALDEYHDAIDFCHRSRLYSANTVRDFLDHQIAISAKPEPEFDVNAIPVSNAKYHVSTEKRPLDVYTKVGDQNANTY